MTTTQITTGQLNTLRTGDRITALNGKPINLTVTRPLGKAVEHGTPSIGFSRPGYTGPINLYPDTYGTDTVLTVEQADTTPTADPTPVTVTATPIARRALTHIAAGERIIIERRGDTLLPTRRKTRVEIVTVLDNVKGGGFRCRTLTTTGGTIVAAAATVYSIAA